MLCRMNPKARAVAPFSEAYLWAVAEGYRDVGFEDLTPLLKAQHEAKEGRCGDMSPASGGSATRMGHGKRYIVRSRRSSPMACS